MGKRLGAVRALRAVAIAFGVALPTITAFWLPAHGDGASSSESTFISATNQERAQRGSSTLQVASDLVAVARHHSQAMAAQSRLYHNPNVGNEVQGWQLLGENVGTGPGAPQVEQAFMASPEHRSNILNPAFSEIGVTSLRSENVVPLAMPVTAPLANCSSASFRMLKLPSLTAERAAGPGGSIGRRGRASTHHRADHLPRHPAAGARPPDAVGAAARPRVAG